MTSMVHHSKSNRTVQDRTFIQVMVKGKIIKTWKGIEYQLEKDATEALNKTSEEE